jgi:hypothetical protein
VCLGRFGHKNQQIFSKFSVGLMAKSRFRLDVRRALKDGTYPIQIIVGHGTNIYLGTGVYASVGEWNARTQQYIGKGARRINAALVSMLAMVTNRIMELKETGQWPKLSRRQIKQMLTDLELEKPTIDVPTLSDVFSSMCEGRAQYKDSPFSKGCISFRLFPVNIKLPLSSNLAGPILARALLTLPCKAL